MKKIGSALARAWRVWRGNNAPGRFIKRSYANAAGARTYKLYLPAGFSGQALPLVVMLHGCKQTPDDFAAGTGMNELADELQFLVVYPAQAWTANYSRCWNWFRPRDQRRDGGEPSLIAGITKQVIARHNVDERRVYIAGLSAGGAMASAMLATYPEVFAGGALIAGLPYGTASNVQEAFESMFKGRSAPARRWGDLVRAASPHRGPWPKISIWHGSADATVIPMNRDEIIKQWTDVHGLPATPNERTTGRGFERAVWRDRDGREVIEAVTIPGMAHGTPLATGPGDGCCGNVGPFLLEVGVSSSHHIAQFFGLTDAGAASRDKAEHHVAAAAAEPAGAFTPSREDILLPGEPEPKPDAEEADDRPRLAIDVQAVIAKALRAAGLMRP